MLKLYICIGEEHRYSEFVSGVSKTQNDIDLSVFSRREY